MRRADNKVVEIDSETHKKLGVVARARSTYMNTLVRQWVEEAYQQEFPERAEREEAAGKPTGGN